MPFDMCNASLASLMKVNRITTGKMNPNPSKNTPSAPRKSSLVTPG